MKCEAKRERGNSAVGNWARRTLAREGVLHINEAKGCLKASDSGSKASEDTTGKPLMLLKLCQAAICIFSLQKGNAVLIRFYLPFPEPSKRNLTGKPFMRRAYQIILREALQVVSEREGGGKGSQI